MTYACEKCKGRFAGARALLRADRGASFIVALVFLLVCTMVATVVIASSSVSVERSKKTTKEQQAYFAVSSGIQTARSLACERGSIANLILTRAKPADQLDPGTTSDGSALANWATQAARSIASGSTSPQEMVTKIDSFTVEGATVPEVKLTYSMKTEGAEQYYITIKAELADGGDYAYTLSTTVPAMLEGSTTEGGLVIHWGPNSTEIPVEYTGPVAGMRLSTELQAQCNVWGTTRDSWYTNQWAKCTWKATANSELMVLSDSSHYVCMVYYQGKYYVPVCTTHTGITIIVITLRYDYYGWDMAVKLGSGNYEGSLTAMPADDTYSCQRRAKTVGGDDDDLQLTGKRNFGVQWVEVA